MCFTGGDRHFKEGGEATLYKGGTATLQGKMDTLQGGQTLLYNSKRDCGKRNLVEFLLNELFPNRFEECNRDYLIMKYIINIKEV